MEYKWSEKDGILEKKTGKQIMSLRAVNCTKKFRNECGKMFVYELNRKENPPVCYAVPQKPTF